SGHRDEAIRAVEQGAHEFVMKPYQLAELEAALDRAQRKRVARDPVVPLFDRMIGDSLAARQVFSMIERVADTDATVLVRGESGDVRVDVRVVAATHRPLESMVREGTFREDLFYRLNVFPLPIPPLRERGSDVPALVEYFILHASNARKRTVAVSPTALEMLR